MSVNKVKMRAVLAELEGKNLVRYDIGPRGGSIRVRAESVVPYLFPTAFEFRISGILDGLPEYLGAGCNYLGGGVRGAVHGITLEDMVKHGLAHGRAKVIRKFVEVLIERYIELEGSMNAETDEDGEPNWDAKATLAARKSGAISAY